jgi:methyl-accepting chemotaxis protein
MVSIVHSQDEVEVLETALLRILNASRQIAEQLKHACARITIASDEMLSMAEELSFISQRQSASIYHLSENLEANADASRTIAENSNKVAGTAESTFLATREVKETVRNTITSMHEIREQTGKDSERIVYLGEKVSQIGNVVTMINTIADQTRLIAFNASIEAAGAGETGGRFSIVATEVRRLANTVVEALEEIRELVSSIQSATRELILASETGIRKVNQGVTSITETGQTLQQIIDMIDSTTRSAKEISVLTQQQQTEYAKSVQEIKEIADASELSVDMSKRSTHIARELRTLSNELDAIIQSFLT